LRAGLGAPGANTDVPGVRGWLDASLGALLTFQAGLTLGAHFDLDAVTLIVSSLKKISKEMFGIWTNFFWNLRDVKRTGWKGKVKNILSRRWGGVVDVTPCQRRLNQVLGDLSATAFWAGGLLRMTILWQ
jgi:hypothetical protein